MKVKRLEKGEGAREKIKKGIDLVADYTKITLGPKGRNVALKQLGPLPTRVVNDGVTIAKEVKSEDPYIQSGVEMVQEICNKTNDNAGDGTTQTALLAQAIINEGNKRLVSGYNPIDLKHELEEDCAAILEELTKMAIPVKDTQTIRRLATISGNNDEVIGDAVGEIMDKVGLKASIIIERGNTENIRVESVRGIYFERGFDNRVAFINNFQKALAEYEEPNIFLINEDLNWNDEIVEFMEQCVKNDFKKMVFIARNINGEALETMALSHKAKYEGNVEMGGINVLAIEAPVAQREDFFSDLSIYTGAKVVKKLISVNPSDIVGSCEKLVCSSKTTTIVKGRGKEEDVNKRIQEIKGQIEQLDSAEKTTRENFEKRLDTLESGVGIIYSGGKTEIEIKDRFLRLEDAVRASKSAVKEGYVAGGGFTYLLLSKLAKTEILANSLKEVLKQVALNAGKSPDSILEKCLELNLGYNAKTDQFENLIETGVIDAALVLKNALQNAVSLATLFLTTEAIICEEEVERKLDFNK